MIKIISGEFKGRLLKTPKNIRPILAQIKKSVFDILTPYLNSCIFLDLYAGSGAVGLEAVSRGANFCVFVEKDRFSLRCISENIINLNCQEKTYVVKADILKDLIWVEKVRKVLYEKFGRCDFDIIFIGAPYVEKRLKDGVETKVLTNFSNPTIEIIYHSKLLNKNGILVVQHSKKEILNKERFNCFREETYGDTIVSFLKYFY